PAPRVRPPRALHRATHATSPVDRGYHAAGSQSIKYAHWCLAAALAHVWLMASLGPATVVARKFPRPGGPAWNESGTFAEERFEAGDVRGGSFQRRLALLS